MSITEFFEEFRSARFVLGGAVMTTMTIDELTALVISCAIAVHEALRREAVCRNHQSARNHPSPA